MSKRKDLIKSYDNFKMKSFYGVGQRKGKLFMNSMLKKLDAQIKNSLKILNFRIAETLYCSSVVF